MDERHFSELVGKVYGAATDPAQMSGLAEAIARAFDTHSVMLFLHKKPSPVPEFERVLSATANFDGWAYSAYGQYFHARDEWYTRGIRKPLTTVNIGEELIGDAQFERTEFCNDFCQRLDTFRVLGTSFLVDDVLGSVGIHRSRRARRFDEHDRDILSLLVPHLQRSLQIHRRLQLAERNCAASLRLLDSLSIGVILVDRAARILFANPVADRALQAGRGLTVRQGSLHAERFGQTPKLHRLIVEAGCRSDGAGSLLRLDSRSGAGLNVLVAPWGIADGTFAAEMAKAVVVFSVAETMPAIGDQALFAAFGLTQAEARLAAALASGESMMRYADRNGISVNTVKTQLRQVFTKTGCSRQAELIRTIYSDLAVRLASRRSPAPGDESASR